MDLSASAPQGVVSPTYDSTSSVMGIVFDKDGTLFDFNATWAVWAHGLLKALAKGDAGLAAVLCDALGYDPNARRFVPSSPVIAGTADDIAGYLLPHLPERRRDDLIAEMNMRASAAPQVEAIPLAPFLGHLRAHGLRLGVATNDAEAPALAHLRAAGIEAAFDFIAGADSGYGAKPGPGQLLAFAGETGLRPEDCIMVGDSLHDLHAAKAAGMRAVAVLTGIAVAEDLAHAAEAVLPSIADLPDWLGLPPITP